MTTASDLFVKGNDEFVNENFEKAIQLYTDALAVEPNRDEIFSNRSQAYIKLDRFKEAVEDATEAITFNPSNVKAYMRKGIALFHLEDYISAQQSFSEGLKLDENDVCFKTWITKCEAELDLAERAKAGMGDMGLSSEITKEAPSTNTCNDISSNTVAANTANTTEKSSQQSVPAIVMPTKEKSKYDWYQTQTHVVVSILLKNIKQEDTSINIHEQSLSVTIKLPAGSEYCLELELAHPIVPQQSIYKILKSKIEIKLKKQEGLHWHELESDRAINADHVHPDQVNVLAYPSSSHYTRNWDKLAKQAEEEDKKEKSEGDAAVNDLFKSLYADGSDETKKAMMKSFYESGGTVLSTNWKEISKEKVEVQTPDGMEFRKWNS